jgi:hypothetical protein
MIRRIALLAFSITSKWRGSCVHELLRRDERRSSIGEGDRSRHVAIERPLLARKAETGRMAAFGRMNPYTECICHDLHSPRSGARDHSRIFSPFWSFPDLIGDHRP